MRPVHIPIALLLALSCSGQVDADSPGLAVEAVLADGRVVVIIVAETEQLEGWPEKGWRWGSDSGHPKSAILELRVHVAGQPWFVPMSAFVDLGAPRLLEVEPSEQGFTVSIRGGDAGGSYEARLRFADGFLVERVVRHGAFPEVAWERTRYSFNNLDI